MTCRPLRARRRASVPAIVVFPVPPFPAIASRIGFASVLMSSVCAGSVAFGGRARVFVAVTIGVAALAMSLAEQRREFLGETASRLASSRLSKAVFTRRFVQGDISSPPQLFEDAMDLGFRVGHETDDPA